MIDFLKCQVYGLEPSDWFDNEYLEFTEKTSMRTGEIDKKYVAKFKGLKFIIYKYENGTTMFIHGSLHKFYNSMRRIYAPNQITEDEKKIGFNGNSFTYANLIFALHDLESFFNVDIKNTKLQNLEFGVNVIHHLNTSAILENLMLHKGAIFKQPLSNTFREVVHRQFYVKCYDKALQYGIQLNVIRFELSYKKMKQLKELGICNLFDLVSIEKLEKLKTLLLQRWSEIHLYDYTINESDLTAIEQIRIKDFRNINYWLGINSNHLDRPKKRYLKIEANHSQKIKEQLWQLISNEWDKLLMCVSSDHLNIKSILTHPNSQHESFYIPILHSHY